MLYDMVQLLLVSDTMDAATVSHIVVDAHRERAWALRNEADVTAYLREFAAASLEDIVLTQVHFAIHLQAFHTVVQSVEGTEECRFAATGRTDDAGNLVLWDANVHILQNLGTIDINIQVLGVELCMSLVSKHCIHVLISYIL